MIYHALPSFPADVNAPSRVSDTQTLGEEYVDIWQYSATTRNLPTTKVSGDWRWYASDDFNLKRMVAAADIPPSVFNPSTVLGFTLEKASRQPRKSLAMAGVFA